MDVRYVRQFGIPKKNPDWFHNLGSIYKSGDVLFLHGRTALSSALTGFASEFETESGGAQSLLSPENWSQPIECSL